MTNENFNGPVNVVKKGSGIQLGMNADNWRVLSGSFNDALNSTIKHDLKFIEFGTLDGQNFIQGLGFDPAIPYDIDEMKLKRTLDNHGIKVSQVDGSYPLTGPTGGTYGVPYVWRAIRLAHLLDCPYVDNTDGAANSKPEGWSDQKIIDHWRYNIELVLERAESYKIGFNLEPHGPFTNNIELIVKLLKEFDSPWFGINFDTGNTFIFGHDPLTYLKAIRPWLKHIHCKDVPHSMAEALRGGGATGIASSDSTIGKGANAENIKKCIEYLVESKWDGVMSVETLGTPENIEGSVSWLNSTIKEAESKNK